MNLPGALYLLCHDADRARLGDDNALVRGQLLRAAAVAELRLTGLLTDSGRQAVRTGCAVPDDGFLAEVLAVVPPGTSASWFTVVDTGWEDAEASVRARLVALGSLTVGPRRWLGGRPRTGPDPDVVRALHDRVRAVVLSGDPAAAPLPDVVLAVLALDGDVRTVFWGPEHRRHRAAIRGLGTRVDAELTGLRTALSWSMAARRTAASA